MAKKNSKKAAIPKEPRECWCPCRCGCIEDMFAILPNGLCPDCEEGNHEVFVPIVPYPECPALEDLLRMHQSIARQIKKMLRKSKSPAA